MDDGIVIWFDHQKGYGFIKRNDGKDMFTHTKFMQLNGRIGPGDRVRFESSIRHKGLATRVSIIDHGQLSNNNYLKTVVSNF